MERETGNIEDSSISFDKRDPLEVLSWTMNFLYEDLDPDHWDDVEKQKLLLDVFSHLMKRSNEVLTLSWKAIEFAAVDLKKIQTVLRDHFETHFLPLIKGERDKSPDWPRPITRQIEFYRVDQGVFEWGLFTVEKSHPPENDAIINFRAAIEALSRQPFTVDTFQWCEGCEKIFIPYGKGVRKKRRFCSHACNMRYNSKVRRKKAKKQNSQEA